MQESYRTSMIPQRPIIGIPLDLEKKGSYSKFPWYAMRQNYCSAVSMAGGIPVLIPYDELLIETYINIIDGVLFTGGDFDIPPHFFGATDIHPTVSTKPERTSFELTFTQKILGTQKPILGICGGMQLINVVLGGTLIQHIPDYVDRPLAHEQPNDRSEPGHIISVLPDSLLSRAVKGAAEMAVNTAHHQAVDVIAPGLQKNAWTSDGVIEGIESSTHPFCLGVQWHPEFHVDERDPLIFDAFVAACAEQRA